MKFKPRPGIAFSLALLALLIFGLPATTSASASTETNKGQVAGAISQERLEAAELAINTGAPCAPSCVMPDNGFGTVDLPGLCDFVALSGGMQILNGLPPGTTVEIDPVLTSFFGIVRSPGGSLGGEVLQFNATLAIQLTGTGSLLGFSRFINMPMFVEIHTAPRTPFTTPQTFACDLQRLQGQITGDPDFDLLRITAGTAFGMPSPGQMTLTQMPGGQWNVESFFDITYRVDFVGRPGGALSGMSGSTTGTCRMTQGFHFWVPADGHKMHYPQLPDASGWDVFGVSPMVLGDDWRCTSTGPVKDIHFWGSWRNGTVGLITSFDISIYADVPAGVDLPYSHPGALLWQRNVTDFCSLPFNPGTSQGWYQPLNPAILFNNHTQYFQYDISLQSPDWFVQSFGTIYWLCIKANLADPVLTSWGWKSSINHYNDDAVWQSPTPGLCSAPENGGGSVDLPAPCPYPTESGTIDIINGLPPSSQINSLGNFNSYFSISHFPGGSLGGGFDDFKASLTLQMQGTGAFSFYNRVVNMPIQLAQIHNAPRLPGQILQSFPADFARLQGQLLPGDPDFDLLRISGGTDFGMPSPGHTTLTMLPGGTQFNVDSFFDLMYRMDFVGSPGGPFAGMSGSTVGVVRIHQGSAAGTKWIELREPPAFATSMDLAFVITDGTTPTTCDCRPGDSDNNSLITISDVVYLINYIFAGGPNPSPYPVCSGDANCDCIVTISDAVYLINYIFAGGMPPCDCTDWLSNCGSPLH